MFLKKIILSIFIGFIYFFTSALYLNRVVYNHDIVLKGGIMDIGNTMGFKKSISLEIKEGLSSLDNAILSRCFVAIHKSDPYIYLSVKSMFIPEPFFSIIDSSRLSPFVSKKLNDSVSNSALKDMYSIVKIKEISTSNYFSNKLSFIKLLIYSLIVSALFLVILAKGSRLRLFK